MNKSRNKKPEINPLNYYDEVSSLISMKKPIWSIDRFLMKKYGLSFAEAFVVRKEVTKVFEEKQKNVIKS